MLKEATNLISLNNIHVHKCIYVHTPEHKVPKIRDSVNIILSRGYGPCMTRLRLMRSII